jgi:hypothetical protein
MQKTLYRRKFDAFIRRFDNVGYICGKSDFGGRVVDAAGAVFLAALSRKGRTLEELAAEIAGSFPATNPWCIKTLSIFCGKPRNMIFRLIFSATLPCLTAKSLPK